MSFDASAPGLSPRHFVYYAVRSTLARLTGPDVPGIENESAVELLVGTAAQESGLRALDQITGPNDRTLGPAYGLYQIEPATRADVHANYLRTRPALNGRVCRLLAADPSPDHQLVTNLAYATAIARLIYYRSPIRLAAPGDIEGHAWVWKQVFNTQKGKGKEADFVRNWERLVEGRL
ncbi:hypothetical protein ACJ41P_26460 [Azospirillum argentinense]|uniref:Transglycosylase SLT domain-containing protein n=1 Tax=Azospirillum argentinense TaxID=2970906 RepID=A0ABW8VHD0_9PROT